MLIKPLLLCASLSLALSAFAAPPPPADAHAPIPPPPGIDDPGVSAVAPAPTSTSTTPTPANTGTPPAAAAANPLYPPDKPDTRPVRDKATRAADAAKGDTAARAAASDVSIRKQGDDTVEEYRQKGHIWMIRIVKPNGSTQTFMDPTGRGRLQRDPHEGPVDPVYFKVYEWD